MDHSTVKCGCGFAADGPDQEKLIQALDAHECSLESATPWYGWIFSFWGWAILATIGFVIMVVMRPELW